MEGFLSISNTAFPLEVPVLTEFEYDPTVTIFEAFPRSCTEYSADGRQIFDLQSLHNLHIAIRTKILQQWLFFGLLSEFLGCSIKTADFSRRGKEYESVLVINTRFLHNALLQWQKAAKKRPESRHMATIQLLRFAIHQSEIFDTAPTERYDYSLGAVSLSVKLLIEFLTSISNATFVPQTGILYSLSQSFLSFRHVWKNHEEIPVIHKIEQLQPPPPIYAGTQRLTPAVWFLLGVFTSNGWCKSQARQICQLYDYSTINYLALISRELPPSGNHDRCKEQLKCVAFNLDPKTNGHYRTAHFTADCQCTNPDEVLYFELGKLKQIIDKGAIPILYMDLNDSKPQVYLSELNYQTQYFAISHVWSDGLGNQVQNGIRPCQAARLQSILKRAEVLYDGKGALVKYEKWAGKGGVCLPMRLLLAWKKPEHRVYFWLDTLCVPTGDVATIPEVKELKGKAIKHITPIFSGASAVIILDSELQKIGPERNNRNGRVDDEVLAARVLATKWMQRAWTLEEGSLARKCFFTVGDTLQVLRQNSVVIDPLGRRICDSFRSTRQSWRTRSPLDYAIARFKNGIPRIVEEILSEGRKQAFAVSSISQRREQLKKIRVKSFVHGWNNLLRRTTTEPRDMQTIFANILDFNASSISKYHPDDGLVAILRSCEELPLSLLYNGGSRLQDVNAIEDAWIPTSIDGLPLQDHGILQRTTSEFKIITTGVDAESIDIWITEVKVPFQADFFCIRDSNTGQQYVVEKQTDFTQGSVEFGQKMQDSYESAIATCIIMDKRGGSTSLEGYSGRGALFSVCEMTNSGQNIQVRFNSPLQFWTLAQWQQNVLRYNPDPHQMPYFPVQHLKDDQNILLQLGMYMRL